MNPLRIFSFSAVLAYLVTVHAAEILSRTHTGREFKGERTCQAPQHVSTHEYNVTGATITRRSFSCTGDISKYRRELPERAESTSPAVLKQDNVVECHTGENCQCGIQASCSCGDEPAFAPAVGDCSMLANSMIIVTQVVGQTFVVEAGGFELLSFQSCSVQFNNFQNVPVEYCWDELGKSIGTATQACFNEGGGPTGFCSGINGLWDVEIERFSP